MRPTAWVSFLALFLLTAAVCKGLPVQARPAAPKAGPPQSWVVKGGWMTTNEEAAQDALEKAQAKVTEHLRGLNPPMEFPLDATYFRQKVWRDLKADDQAVPDLKWKEPRDVAVALGGENDRDPNAPRHTVVVEVEQFPGLGEMRRAAVRVEITPSVQTEFEKQERLYQAKQRQDRVTSRQGVLARLLAGVIAVLVAVACYLRLEDATKGYYTTLLRLAAVTFVVLVGGGIWLLGVWL
jgi:hypothetical protein